MKIVLFGDSLLKNFGKDYIAQFEAALPGADIYNCSVGGWDTDDGLKKAPFIAKLKPDIAILGFGTNDAAPWKQVPLDRYLENVSKIVEEFADSKIIFFLPPPVHPENGHNADHRRFPDTVQQYHDETKKVLEGSGTTYLDSHAVFAPLLKNDQSYHVEDGVHLNDLGYKILIEEFSKLIRDINRLTP